MRIVLLLLLNQLKIFTNIKKITMYGFLLTLFIIVCFALIVSILLQSSKGGGLAGAFGGGGGGDMSAVFGGRGAANFLSKTTTWLATLFLGISLALSFLNRGATAENQSLVQQEQQRRGAGARLPIVPTNEQQLLPVESGQVTTDSTQ